MTKYATDSFNDYWNYHLAIPASVFPKAKTKRAMKKVDDNIAAIQRKTKSSIKAYNTIMNTGPRIWISAGGMGNF